MSEEAYEQEKQDVLRSLRSSILFKISQRIIQIGIDEILGKHEPGVQLLQKEWKTFTPSEIVELSLIWHRLRHLGLGLSAKTLELESKKVLLPSKTLASALSPRIHEASRKVTEYNINEQKSEAIATTNQIQADPVVVRSPKNKLIGFPIKQDVWEQRMDEQRDQRIQYAVEELEEKERQKQLAAEAAEQEQQSSDFGSTDSSDEMSSPEKTPRMFMKVAKPLPSESSSSSSESTARQQEEESGGSERDELSEKSTGHGKSELNSAKSGSSSNQSNRSDSSKEESEAEVEVLPFKSNEGFDNQGRHSLINVPSLVTKPKTEIKIERKLEEEEFSTSDELSINSDDHESKQTSEWLKRMWTTPNKLTTDTLPKSQPKSSIMSLLSTDAPSSSQTAFQARLLGSGSREDVPRLRSPISPKVEVAKPTDEKIDSVNVVEVEPAKDTDEELEEIGEFDALDAMSDSGSDSISF